MKIICAWCKKIMQDSPSDEVSHGICATCEKKFLEETPTKGQKFWTFITGRSLFWQFMAGTHPIVREREVLI